MVRTVIGNPGTLTACCPNPGWRRKLNPRHQASREFQILTPRPPPDACGARHMVDAQRTPATTPALFQASDVQREGATCHMLDKGVTGSQTQHAGRSGQYTGSPA